MKGKKRLSIMVMAIMLALACVTVAAFAGACKGAYLDPESVGAGGGGGGGEGGGKSLEGTWTRSESLGYGVTLVYGLIFTRTKCDFAIMMQTGGGTPQYSTQFTEAKYTFTGSKLTLDISGARIDGSATLSGDTLKLSGFNSLPTLNGTYTKQGSGGEK
jgi:hypothetical protein